MLKFSEIFEFSKEKFRKIPILKEFEWFEWFEWFGPSPIELFNSGADVVGPPRHERRVEGLHVEEARRREERVVRRYPVADRHRERAVHLVLKNANNANVGIKCENNMNKNHKHENCEKCNTRNCQNLSECIFRTNC